MQARIVNMRRQFDDDQAAVIEIIAALFRTDQPRSRISRLSIARLLN